MGVPLVLREGEPRDAVVVGACIGTLVALVFAANAYLTPTETPPDRRFEAIDEYEDDADSDE
jgi:hypothetical protein